LYTKICKIAVLREENFSFVQVIFAIKKARILCRHQKYKYALVTECPFPKNELKINELSLQPNIWLKNYFSFFAFPKVFLAVFRYLKKNMNSRT
jgi:hypothetical protein